MRSIVSARQADNVTPVNDNLVSQFEGKKAAVLSDGG